MTSPRRIRELQQRAAEQRELEWLRRTVIPCTVCGREMRGNTAWKLKPEHAEHFYFECRACKAQLDHLNREALRIREALGLEPDEDIPDSHLPSVQQGLF